MRPQEHAQELVTTGLHARMRHPIYIAHLLNLAGWAIGSGLLVSFVLLAISALVTFPLMIWIEEHELEKRFGQRFREYKARVPLNPATFSEDVGMSSRKRPRGHVRFELFVAARYLRAKRRQAVIGVITIISVIGVTAGVASLVIALSINAGFQKDLQDQLLGSQSHINLVRVQNDGIEDWRALMTRLAKKPHVTGVAPAMYGQVMASRAAGRAEHW